ncbi:MAG TPA: amidase family protein [Trebonia sp.]|jgi:amidase|nr:amidase family protein [Trebonia sp.]
MSTWVIRLDSGDEGSGDGQGDGGRPRLAVKDCIDVAGLRTSVGCQVVAEMTEPPENDAAVVASARAAGARIAGKTTLTELCWSANGVNHWQGTPVNPRDPRRVPGGSSSGSAVAVATGEADVAYGTDTGGSVRIPACCCGAVGLKTAWGRVPLKGVYPLAPSLDTVGPLGADLAAVETGMRLLEAGFRTRPWNGPLAAARIDPGVEVDPAVDAAVDRALAAAAVGVTRVAAIDFAEALYAAGVIIDAEGFRSNAYLMPYLEDLSPHVRRNMERGARLSPSDLAGARRVKDTVRSVFEALLADYPVLVTPVMTGQPPLLGEHGYSMTMLTAPVNLAGLPALSLPVGPGTSPGGGPGEGRVIASVQVIGADEESVLAFGRMIESALLQG